MSKTTRHILQVLSIVSLLAVGCSGKACGAGDAEIITIDGSSTVFPLTEAVAEEFQAEQDARVTIGVSGTGGGFKKLCNGEVAIAGASRPIKPSEVTLCEQGNVDYIELPVAYDGIAVVVNPANDFVDYLTVDELKRIWEPGSNVTTWADVRPGWPSEPLTLYGAGVDSGTYDYFTKAIVGKEHASRGDFTSSEDDNILVQGIAGDKNALGFFGFAYYAENQGKLELVPIDDGAPQNGAGPIAPSPETIANGTYQPLSRPIFIYAAANEVEREVVDSFVDFFIAEADTLAPEVGYVPLPDETYALVQKRFDARTTGSLFKGEGSTVGVTVREMLLGAEDTAAAPE